MSTILSSFFSDDKTVFTKASEEAKKDLTFEFDDFNKPKTFSDVECVANLIHTLLFLEKNTYPDCPNMGIGIQNYQFEMLNDETIIKIKKEINEQINEFMPTVYLRNLVVKKIPNENNKNVLGIGFEINIKNYNTTKEFFIILSEQAGTRDLLSQIIF